MEDSSNTNETRQANTEIIALLAQQNLMLKEMKGYFDRTIEQDSDKRLHFRSNVIDIDMSIGSMIGFMFKWLIASIPVGIVVGIIYAIIIAIFGGF